jgi:hypothetical protein
VWQHGLTGNNTILHRLEHCSKTPRPNFPMSHQHAQLSQKWDRTASSITAAPVSTIHVCITHTLGPGIWLHLKQH